METIGCILFALILAILVITRKKKRKTIKFWFDEGSFTTLEEMEQEGHFSPMKED